MVKHAQSFKIVCSLKHLNFANVEVTLPNLNKIL